MTDKDARIAELVAASRTASAMLKARESMLAMVRLDDAGHPIIDAATANRMVRATVEAYLSHRRAALPAETRALCEKMKGFAIGEHSRLTADDLLRAARLLEQAALTDDWQDIETAPKDGTAMLLWWRSCTRPHVGAWAIDEFFGHRDGGYHTIQEGWRCDGDECIPRNQQDCTHWRRLPQPPATQGKE